MPRTYAGEMIAKLLDRGPFPGEDFFRMKVTGAGETNWFNVTPEQLGEIYSVLDGERP